MPAVVHLFDKVVDASVVLWNKGSAGAFHRRLSRLRDHAQQALSCSLGGLTPHSARSSNRARQWQLIRAERSSNGSSRSHRALEGLSLPSCFVPFFFLPRLTTPALRLGVIGSWQPSVFYLFLRRYGRRSGQPSSSSVARRACVHVFPFSLVFLFYAVRCYVTGTRLLQVRLLGHPELRKRPWPLRRPRGDGNGGRFVRSPCLPSWRGLRLYAVHQMLSLVPVQRRSSELRATTVSETTLPAKTQGRTLDCPFPPRIVAGWFFILCRRDPLA